jgi:NAD(P)-dependent dehydrogenase (short-subunit alcohol dehydrogenase family)
VNWANLQYEKPNSYSEHSAYSLSKLLMAMYSMELAERVGGPDLPVVCCDPGTVNTKMLLAGELQTCAPSEYEYLRPRKQKS